MTLALISTYKYTFKYTSYLSLRTFNLLPEEFPRCQLSEMIRVANLQIKEQKVVVDELSNLKKSRVSRVLNVKGNT